MKTASRLSPVAFGLAFGVLWGLSVCVMGLLAHYFSYGVTFVTSMRTIYLGYEPSIAGSLIGGVMGFVDAFIGGLILAWLYNCFACVGCKKDE